MNQPLPSQLTQTGGGSRSRPQARKKPSDDAAYFGPSAQGGNPIGGMSSTTKRHATDKAEGEKAMKRKRVEPVQASNRRFEREFEEKISLVDFTSMPTAALYRYLEQFDLIPYVYPSPLLGDDPPRPSFLENQIPRASCPPTPPTTTPANRPRREPKDQNGSRRRSNRLVEETRSRTPVLADVDEVHGALASIAERHFHEHSIVSAREEVDILTSFMCKVKTKLVAECDAIYQVVYKSLLKVELSL